MTSKLIILRGPSASGKSTVAKALLERAGRKICLIEQDYYRFIFRPRDKGSSVNSKAIHKMIKDNVLTALDSGYDVILEGILSAKSYAGDVREIIRAHPAEHYSFYFDVSLEETLRRYAQRASRDTKTYKEDDLRTFYPRSYEPIWKGERVISESFSVEEAVVFIVDISNLGCRSK